MEHFTAACYGLCPSEQALRASGWATHGHTQSVQHSSGHFSPEPGQAEGERVVAGPVG